MGIANLQPGFCGCFSISPALLGRVQLRLQVPERLPKLCSGALVSTEQVVQPRHLLKVLPALLLHPPELACIHQFRVKGLGFIGICEIS